MIYYKTLHKNGMSPFAGVKWHLPNGKPGDWMPCVENVTECRSGYHICRKKDLIFWLCKTLYTVEVRGRVYRYCDKCACHQARLLRKIETWTPEIKRLFSADCSERVLPIFEKIYPKDSRPRYAIRASRRFTLGEIDKGELVAAEAAGWVAATDAGWAYGAAAGNAAGAASQATGWVAAAVAARGAEHIWQTKILFQYLNRPVFESLEIARAKLEAA